MLFARKKFGALLVASRVLAMACAATRAASFNSSTPSYWLFHSGISASTRFYAAVMLAGPE